MSERLKGAYRELGETSPGYGDVGLAIRTARRRQLGYGVIAPLLVALALGGTALVIDTERSDSSRPTPPISSITPDEGTVSMVEWVDPPATLGAPAKAGTFLYLSLIHI